MTFMSSNSSMSDAFSALRNASFFDGLSEGACRRLAELSRTRTLLKREFLFMEESAGQAIYLLLTGKIQLLKTSPDGRETVIKTVQPGELFAEVILFEKPRYPVTAVAIADSTVLELPRTGVLRLLEEPAFRNDFITMLLQRQRYLADRIQQLSSSNVTSRFLLFLREQFGEKETITPGISKKDMALAIDTTPESLSRLLKRLEKQGVLRQTGKTLHLKPEFWSAVE